MLNMDQFHITPISTTLVMSMVIHIALWFNLGLPGSDDYSYAEQSQTMEISLVPKMPLSLPVTPAQKKFIVRPVAINKPATETLPAIVPEPMTESVSTVAETQIIETTSSQPEVPRYTAKYLNNPPPAYPLAARRHNIEGKVLVRAEVQADGSCSQVELKIPSASRLLDQATLDAVKKWRFVPATLRGETVVAWVEIPITFKLNN